MDLLVLFKVVKRQAWLLLFTAILAAGASILVMVQQFEINDLRSQNIQSLSLLKEFQTKQLTLDEAVTSNILKLKNKVGL